MIFAISFSFVSNDLYSFDLLCTTPLMSFSNSSHFCLVAAARPLNDFCVSSFLYSARNAVTGSLGLEFEVEVMVETG